MRRENRSIFRAGVLLDALARRGLELVCVAPGSRSTPLVIAAAEHERLRVVTGYDERSVGFLALGAARAAGRPSAVVTTSGTATANLYPAMIEAATSGVPLLALTADRPVALRGTDANQTIDQVRLYGGFARAFLELPDGPVGDDAATRLDALAQEAWDAALGPPAGPVQINAPFRRPLEPTLVAGDVPAHVTPLDGPTAPRGRPGITRHDLGRVAQALREARRPLLIAGPTAAGPGSGRVLADLARHLGVPLLADPLSGVRHLSPPPRPVLGAYDAFLRDVRILRSLTPDVVVRFGGNPVSTAVGELLRMTDDARQFVVRMDGRQPEVPGEVVPAVPGAFAGALRDAVEPLDTKAWTDRWIAIESVTRGVLAKEVARGTPPQPFEPAVVRAAARGVAGTLVPVLVGNSMPVRDWDRFVGPEVGPLTVYGNRGASGIDGLVSTAFGIAAGSGGRAVAVLGDLSLLHDQNGLFAAREPGLAVVFVVVNNDGGGIFQHLAVREFEPAFTRHIVVPHGLDLRRIAELFRLPFERMVPDGDLAATVARAIEAGTTRIIEVRTDRVRTHRRHAEVLAAVSEALTELAGEVA